MENNVRYMKVLLPVVGIGIVLTIVTFGLSIAILVKVNKGFDGSTQTTISTTASTNTPGTTGSPTTTTTTTRTNPPSTTTNTFITTGNPTTTTNTLGTTGNPTTTTSQLLPNNTLAAYIRIEEVMTHLNALQRIANESDGNRAINSVGFNRTLDYVTETLTNHTNFTVNRVSFSVRDFELATDPILISSIDGNITNYTYSANASIADFLHVKYSVSSNISDVFEVTVIPNGGCTEADWQNASAPTSGRVALVKRGGSCAFSERAANAPKFDVSGILFYNDGTLPDRFEPIEVSLAQDNYLPALFLSYTAGQALADAALDPSMNVTVQLGIDLQDLPDFPVGNICADTPHGNVTQTIVIGSHSDGVPAGPGINDNGSGTAANLALAIALARAYNTSTYAAYKYRVRFCWWGAEEVGLLGAKDHVSKAQNSTVVGERLRDYLINLNYDMLGSPNFMFGIYDGKTARNDTPFQARPGSDKITDVFKEWFQGKNLPWNYTDFSGRSDYGPFLAGGIVAGGLFSGADGIKTQEEYDYYDALLGSSATGTVNATHDPCYHKACDSIQNINQFAYDKMVQAAVYILEYLGHHDDLKTWLYPNGTIFDF